MPYSNTCTFLAATTVAALARQQPLLWVNPHLRPYEEIRQRLTISDEQISDAAARMERFAPFIQRRFPETVPSHGILESPLTPIPAMQAELGKTYGGRIPGRLLLKRDDQLDIAGSIKARGGVYEILKHAEDLALEQGILQPGDNYAKLDSDACRAVFHQYTVHVSSTGNLGLSIGLISAALGFQVTVHMPADGAQWIKDLLRAKGVTVQECTSDYGKTVQEGRRSSDADPMSYFVDDENSLDLFLGYAVAARRLADQLEQQGIPVDKAHPLLVYLPCGVGGAPGGITYGLKRIFGDAVHCFFVEPVNSPCMTLGMATGLVQHISVRDIGLSGMTHADGLAISRPSGFVGKVMEPLLSGCFTVADADLYDHLRQLYHSENIFLEPSSCCAFTGPVRLMREAAGMEYLRKHLGSSIENCCQIAWATGGGLVPPAVAAECLNTRL